MADAARAAARTFNERVKASIAEGAGSGKSVLQRRVAKAELRCVNEALWQKLGAQRGKALSEAGRKELQAVKAEVERARLAAAVSLQASLAAATNERVSQPS
eukprot:1306305-Pyramimonas_sp.AAC.1